MNIEVSPEDAELAEAVAMGRARKAEAQGRTEGAVAAVEAVTGTEPPPAEEPPVDGARTRITQDEKDAATAAPPDGPADEDKGAEGKAADAVALSLSRLLDVFVPTDALEIRDVRGNVYTVSAERPARAEARVFRLMREMLPTIGKAGTSIWDDITEGRLGQAAAAIVQLAGDEEMLERVEQAFLAAFPDAYQTARTSAIEAGAEPTDIQGPADLFSLGRMAGALVPLLLAAPARFLEGAGAMKLVDELGL